ncbi:DUF305 domain-containing protein [Micromonospora sonneratiae]|uniref:DUF305 domain-containing protein n=1 Tax=Micromonospora sonneratiae TaxID=1184706 RepID=A0ABW3Y992_9ACTN
MGRKRQRIMVAVPMVVLLLIGGAGADATGGRQRHEVVPPAPAAAPTSPAALVIVPGRPGDQATVKRADEVAEVGARRYNSLDTWFVRMMIPHHTQALRMAALAPERTADDRVRALAARIQASQAPEILQMRAWLDTRGLELDPRGGHDHGTMRGMQTPEAMRRLAAARGRDFDRLFVTMMIEHHQGAIEMATDLLRVGIDVTVEEIATSVAAEQAVEINRMRELFPGW